MHYLFDMILNVVYVNIYLTVYEGLFSTNHLPAFTEDIACLLTFLTMLM